MPCPMHKYSDLTGHRWDLDIGIWEHSLGGSGVQLGLRAAVLHQAMEFLEMSAAVDSQLS
jgi:hypothetical protein